LFTSGIEEPKSVQKKERKMADSTKAMRVTRGVSYSLFIVLFLLTCCARAQKEEHHVRNIVLVHGAWADGSGWKGVYDILIKDGYNVSIVQEPETSFKEDVATTKRVLALQDGPCILVAHSYGGAVITEAGTDPSVAGLVYIAAHMPDSGENEADDGKRFPSDLSKDKRRVDRRACGLSRSYRRWSGPEVLGFYLIRFPQRGILLRSRCSFRFSSPLVPEPFP
jgi:pimeloyl-ACP methyl ester carboxylesterase